MQDPNWVKNHSGSSRAGALASLSVTPGSRIHRDGQAELFVLPHGTLRLLVRPRPVNFSGCKVK